MTIATKKNLVMDKGATFKQLFRYLGSDNVPVDLTGWTATFKVYKLADEEDLITSAVCTVDADGWITANITDEVSSTLPRGKKAYGLEVTNPEGELFRLLFGQLEVRGVSNV